MRLRLKWCTFSVPPEVEAMTDGPVSMTSPSSPLVLLKNVFESLAVEIFLIVSNFRHFSGVTTAFLMRLCTSTPRLEPTVSRFVLSSLCFGFILCRQECDTSLGYAAVLWYFLELLILGGCLFNSLRSFNEISDEYGMLDDDGGGGGGCCCCCGNDVELFDGGNESFK